MKQEVTITLGLEHEDFTAEVQARFLQTVSVLSGANTDELAVVEVRPGCVKITLEINAEALKKLLHAIEPKSNDLEPLAADQRQALTDLFSSLAYQFIEFNGSQMSAHGSDAIADEVNKIFFIHGWRGDEDSFGQLPDFISKETGCACIKFVYPTGFFERSSSVAFLARAFDNWVRNELEGSTANFGVISHSMGGIIARDFLGSQLLRSEPLSNRVKHVSFIASPQGGAWLSKIAGLLPSSASQQVADLAPSSEYLGRVNSSWNGWLPKQDHLIGHVRSFFASSDEVVDYVSAIGSDPDAVPILNATHSSIIKPKHGTDEIVRTLGRFIRSSGLSSESKNANITELQKYKKDKTNQ